MENRSFFCTYHMNFYIISHFIGHFVSLCWTRINTDDAWVWLSDHDTHNVPSEIFQQHSFHQKLYDTAASCIQWQYCWHLRLITNTTFSHKSLALNRIMHGQLNQLHFIPPLYAVITAVCWIFCFLFPFIHLFALPTGCTPYALLSIITKEFSFHLIILILPSLLKSKDPFRFFHFFDIN